MAQTEDHSFGREVFSNIYLMTIRIIHATVFAKLGYDSINYINHEYGDVITGFATVALYIDPTLWSYAATLCLIIVVTFEYSYFISTVFREIRFSDLMIPFSLGFLETWIAHEVGNPSSWWALNAAIGVAGFAAFRNSLTYPFDRLFGKDEPKIKAFKRFLRGRLIFMVGSVAYSSTCVYLIVSNQTNQLGEVCLIAIYIFGIGFFMLRTANTFSMKWAGEK